MMSCFSLAIQIGFREPPFVLVGSSGSALAWWADVPLLAAAPVAFLITFEMSVRLVRRPRF